MLTPSYNRGELLNQLYASLVTNQNSSNVEIEWLIMNDGSTDKTNSIVKQFQKEDKIAIVYKEQENKGKMVALNELMKEATGDFIIECDSDDYFTKDAFQIIEKEIQQIENWDSIYALCFLKKDQNGNNMGNNFPKEKVPTTMFDLYFKDGVIGEKAFVFQAKIRKQFVYELAEQEKFVTEARMYHKMDLKYSVVCFNETISICEYQESGYSKNIEKVFMQNPKGYYQYFKEMFDHNWKGITFQKRLYIYKHYILFSYLTNQKRIIQKVKGMGNKFAIAILYIPGKLIAKKRFTKK